MTSTVDTTTTTTYAAVVLRMLDLATDTVGGALDGAAGLDELEQLGDDYLPALYAAQADLDRARRALLAPFSPRERASLVANA